MVCSNCASENPEVARFCFRCGQPLREGAGRNYAVQSAERVGQFALISTIMPHSNRDVADHYRWAMLVAGVAVLAFTAFGLLPLAIVSAAFLIPLTYLIYIYDVNVWEDAPAPAVVGLFGLTGVLALLVSMVFFKWTFADQFAQLLSSTGGRSEGIGSVPIWPLILFAVILPIVAEVAKNVGPAFMASRPRYDDMVDGLTFGVAAGTAYAAFETLVAFSAVFTSGELRVTQGLTTWIVVILNVMVVKSLIYGTATGIAGAAFSGRGEGYDGFTPAYFKNFAFAAAMNVAYWLGVRLLAYAAFGQLLGLLWGLVILAILVVRVRVLLHTSLIEAAVEAAAEERELKAAAGEDAFCPECEMRLLPGALFCVVCGESVLATGHAARASLRAHAGTSPAPTTTTDTKDAR